MAALTVYLIENLP